MGLASDVSKRLYETETLGGSPELRHAGLSHFRIFSRAKHTRLDWRVWDLRRSGCDGIGIVTRVAAVCPKLGGDAL